MHHGPWGREGNGQLKNAGVEKKALGGIRERGTKPGEGGDTAARSLKFVSKDEIPIPSGRREGKSPTQKRGKGGGDGVGTWRFLSEARQRYYI